MSRGSEKLSWKALGGKRPCSGCGRAMRIDEVAEHRRILQETKADGRRGWVTVQQFAVDAVWCGLCSPSRKGTTH